MTRSFSTLDTKGNEVSGTVLWEDQINQFALVDEWSESQQQASVPALWLIDLLDDVGVSLEADQVARILPHMREWATEHGAVFDPVPMVLNCPRCGRQHIDQEESWNDYTHRYHRSVQSGATPSSVPPRWTNPPHKSHTCQYCDPQTTWRPAPFETVGVERIESRGKADNWPPIGTINLIVNGEPMIWSMKDRRISYEGVVDLLAFQKHPTRLPRELLWTITYHNKYKSGTLSPGQSVEVDEGLRFTVVMT